MRRLVTYLGSLAIVLFWVSRSATVDTTLIALNSQWKYLDNGSNQQTAWRAPGIRRRRLGVGERGAGVRRRR